MILNQFTTKNIFLGYGEKYQCKKCNKHYYETLWISITEHYITFGGTKTHYHQVKIICGTCEDEISLGLMTTIFSKKENISKIKNKLLLGHQLTKEYYFDGLSDYNKDNYLKILNKLNLYDLVLRLTT
jgi:uncharacterized CHY-type Zn-finger protein